MPIKKTVGFYTLSRPSNNLALRSCISVFESNGYVPLLIKDNHGIVDNYVVIDLDNLPCFLSLIPNLMKEKIVELGTTIFILSNNSLNKLDEFKEFECFTSYSNLITRMFFT